MKFLKQLVVLALFLLALGWVAFMDLTGRGATAKETVPTTFKDDGTLKATIANIDNNKFHVTVSVRVTDRDGEVFGGLEKKDFSVSEDGTAVPVTKFVTAGQQSLRAVLVIDHSGSMMTGGKLQGAKDAARAFLDLLRDDIDHLGVFFFETNVREIQPVGVLTRENRKKVEQAIQGLSTSGGTQMFTAMEKALESMKDVTGRRLLMVLTDGIDDRSNAQQRDRIIARANELHVPLYMIGLGQGKELDDRSMKLFAEKSEGQYKPTPRPEELKKIYIDIGKSLQNEYVVEYDSPYPVEDGRKRNLTITVRHGEKGTSASGEYKVAGVLGSGTRTTPTTGTVPAKEPAPFGKVFFPLLAVLGILFVVPFVLQLRGGKVETPPVTPPMTAPVAMAPRPAPSPPMVQAPARPMQAGGDVCPQCKQYRAPGAPGQRFCMVCERTY